MIIHHHRKNDIPSFSSQSSSSQSSFHILHTWSHSHVIRLTPPHEFASFHAPNFFGTGVKFSLRPIHLLIMFRQYLFTSTSFSLFLESFRFCNWEHLLDGVEFLLFLVIEKQKGKIILREFFSYFICLLNLSQGNL